MIIRNDQTETLDRFAEDDFVQRIKSLIKEHRHYVAESYSENELDVMVKNGIERARKHDIESELAIFRFVDVMFGVAPNFDEHPMIKEFLAPDENHPDERVAAMVRLLTSMDWEEVKKVYDPSAWGLSNEDDQQKNFDKTSGGIE
jgi:hypothetical protein